MIEHIWLSISGFFTNFGQVWLGGRSEMAPLFMGVGLQIALGLMFVLIYRLFKNSKFVTVFELFFEKMYEFFEEILGEKAQVWIKKYIVSLFFIILIVNVSGWLMDILRSMTIVLSAEQWEAMSRYIVTPSSMIEFNIAMAVVSIGIALVVQFKHLGFIKFFHEYVPVTGKGILDVDKGTMKPIVYWPMKILVKLFDIGISMFVGILDIIGIIAKIVSLSARLFGNMLSGGILLGLLVMATNKLTHSTMGINFAFLTPLILFIQGLLVATIQAFVFPLLSAIFIKIGQE